MKRKSPPKPPIAAIKPKKFRLHGDTRVDEYTWLQDPKKPEVRRHIRAENTYADAMMSDTKKLQTRLYKEIRGRMKEDDTSVPIKDGPYYYYTRVKRGFERAIHCRKFGERGKEEIILNENELARGKRFFSLGAVEVSPDHSLIAYAMDVIGDENYRLYIKNLSTGKLVNGQIDSVGDIVWAEDGMHVLYTKEAHPYPPHAVYRHRLGEDPAKDILVYEDPDIQWCVGLGKSRDREYIFIHAGNFDTTEVRYISAWNPLEEPKLVAKRIPHVKYFVDHHVNTMYIMTNERALNYKIMTAAIGDEKKSWKTWLAHDRERPLTGLMSFEKFFVLTVREEGIEQIYILEPSTKKQTRIPLQEGGHRVVVWGDIEFESDFVRLSYQSFISPKTVFDYEIGSKKLIVRKQNKIPGWDPKKYTAKREWIRSGVVRVPVSMVFKKGTKLDGKNPMLLEAYASYGVSSEPYFSISKLSLLKRGWIIALAHPRGGGELGWHWHKEAKLLTKHRTYEDFVAVADYMVQKKYTSRDRLSIAGGSAGGMLIGASLNMRPDLCGAAIAYVPESDLLTSTLDTSLGGTRLHYDETGDARKKSHYFYIKKWSVYEGVKRAPYPKLLVRASMHDVRTPYWEAAKWVARLRARQTGTNPILLKIEGDAGHAGKTGRYEWIKDRAYDFSFLIKAVGGGESS